MDEGLITVEVAYALPCEQKIITLQVAESCTVYEAVIKSGICRLFEQIDPDKDAMGIFGKVVRNPKETGLKSGDRVEIYRPLLLDPKEARVRRANKTAE